MVRLALVLFAVCALVLFSPTPSTSVAYYPGGPWGGLYMPYFDAIPMGDGWYAFVGCVEGEDPSLLWVQICGAAGYHVGPVQVDGTFLIMGQVPEGLSGEVEAQAFSIFAQFSNRCYDTVSN